ncbi:MAG: aminoacyl-tRNA hydrolase [Pseudomonadota bacterium]
MSVRLVVGLGNPGPRYEDTRHNLGFAVAAELAARPSARFGRCPGQARCEIATASLGGVRLLIARPQTFMNRSGEAVAPLLGYFRLTPEDIIVVHDDIDQDLGRIKIVLRGGAGGHKGVLSLAASLGGSDFRRVKVGVGRPRFNENIEQFVLMPVYPDERAAMEETVGHAAAAVEVLLTLGDSQAMTQFNAAGCGSGRS